MQALPLNRANLARLPPPVLVPGFDPARVSAGIVHLGMGGFHRAHMARYTHNLMERRADALGWGIIGAGLMPADRRMHDSLGPQDNLYTLVERGSSHETVTVIGSIADVIFAGESSSALLHAIEQPPIRIVSLTVTENGYCLNRSTKQLDPGHPLIRRDLAQPEQPSSAIGIIVEGYRRRMMAGLPPFTALSCDNIQHNGIIKSYGSAEIIKGVNLDIAEREFVVFAGPSGCGKSTLLRMIAGLEEITAGDLLIDSKRVNRVGPADRGLAMVFQSYALYPHMTVRQNMAFALRLAHVPKAERDRKVDAAARILQLEPYLERRPKDLSGGQRQRVAIGRAIVRQPKIFLFDEPLSNLDAALRGQMRMELLRLHEELNATMIYVTHDQVEAMTMADKIVVLQAGRVEQVGSPLELYHHPANLFVAGFIGSPRMNMMEAKVVETSAAGTSVAVSSGSRITVPVEAAAVRMGDTVTLGIRPEGLRLDRAGSIDGTVALVERLGGLTLLHVDVQGSPQITVQIEGSDTTRVHDRIRLSVGIAACHVFDTAGQALPQLAHHPLAA